MIKRIVKMTFRVDATADFEEIFRMSSPLIRQFEGCRHLELWRSTDDPRIYFTYSFWESPEALDFYRQSDLFKQTWAKTKALFDEAPDAWSVTQLA